MARVIDDRFELLDRLGGGGMGLVWRARDLALHREVALKEVRPPDPAMAAHDPDIARVRRARVLREARALARIVHPHVVTIHHIVDGGEDTYPWLVMELVTGGSLQDRFDRGPLTPAEAAGIGRGALAGLRAAHAADIQHRDIKPPNILLRPDGSPVLTDFGIAAVTGSTVLTAADSFIGTPDYMAPERVAGEDGGPAADLWSLAMTLYVAVEGHHPLRRGSTLATLAAVLSEDVPPPRAAGPLTEALTSVLVRDPAQRPDAAALDRMLATAQHAPAVAPAADRATYRLVPPRPTARPSAQPEGQVPPPAVRRRPVLLYASALGAAALAGALLWAQLPLGGGGADGAGGDTGGGAGGAKSPPPTAAGITIGIKVDQPGIAFRDPDGRYSGFDVDTARYVARELGHAPSEIAWVPVSSRERENALAERTVDMVVATYTMTDGREEEVDFAGPYLIAHQDVLTRVDDFSISSASALNDKKVCSVTGSTSVQNIRTKVAPAAKIVNRATFEDCLTDLAQETVDAVTSDDAILAGHAARTPDAFRLGGFRLTEERYGIGLPKDSPYQPSVQAALKKMVADGSWDESRRKNLPLLTTARPPSL
ncbi:transporter substrate-binding domain-containing protein [Streptomyces sp. NPDC127068]|uniref:bifunctional serine/threonine-protein kinase/glutamate ABC transporter substrate-binding protein n=1 Tax=Streptomyces sp. NPDC127068 TaxID=3347127 RepID=UPI003669CAD4